MIEMGKCPAIWRDCSCGFFFLLDLLPAVSEHLSCQLQPMENGMDLSVEMSTMIATYLATGLVRSGVATREQASEILQEVADGLRQLDHDFPDEFKTNLRAANYLATARRMADLMRARAAAILQWNL